MIFQKQFKALKDKMVEWKNPFNWLRYNLITTKVLRRSPILLSVMFFFLILITYLISSSLISMSVLVASFGTIFVALKYKLDQSTFQKSLFEQRYEIFEDFDQILHNCFNENNKDMGWRDYSDQLDSYFRKSYFLFCRETYDFIVKFRRAVIAYKMLGDNENNLEDSEYNRKKYEQAKSFLMNLVDKQKLSDKFPQLKIDVY